MERTEDKDIGYVQSKQNSPLQQGEIGHKEEVLMHLDDRRGLDSADESEDDEELYQRNRNETAQVTIFTFSLNVLLKFIQLFS